MPVAVITGASKGFGAALSEALIDRGWEVIGTGRGAGQLNDTARRLGHSFVPVVGDIADPAHRDAVAGTVAKRDRLDLLVNNASTLGESPLPALASIAPPTLKRIFDVNVVAPLLLIQLLVPAVQRTQGAIVNLSSDAGIEAYPGWGGYGASKAALDQLSAVLGVEDDRISVYAFDPGDMQTDMHQAAFPGEDISDRPQPATVIPAFLELLESRPVSGRYRAHDSQLVTL